MGGPRTTRTSALLLSLAAVALVAVGTLQLVRPPSGAGAAGVDTTQVAPRPPGARMGPVAPVALVGPVAPVGPVVPPAGSDRPAPARRQARSTRLPEPPGRVVVPTLGIDARVVPIETSGNRLVPPDDPQLLGWWASGAPAASRRGATLVTGHTVHDGGGALDDLETVHRGARIIVRTSHTRLTYQVARVRVYSKAAVSRYAERLFAQDVSGRLVLVTCEGWDGTGYRSNVVVTARLVRSVVRAGR